MAAASLAPTPAAALPGPRLQEPAAELERSVRCGRGVGEGRGTPVLLIHGTFFTGDFWASNFGRALPRAGYPVCVLDLPERATGDVQRSTDYVVHAIRAVAARAGRPIAVVGHSYGSFTPSIALRFWPDLPELVTDVIGLAGVYEHGTEGLRLFCAVPCDPTGAQLMPGSRLLRAVARHDLYDGPGYTAISTRNDEIVFPQPHAGILPGARNVLLQDLCPGRFVEHQFISRDAVAYALALDAIEHPGPADPRRIDRRLCRTGTLPGADVAGALSQLAQFAEGVPSFYRNPGPEPPLRCYLDPACPRRTLRPALAMSATASRSGGRRRVRVRGAVGLPAGATKRCSGRLRVRVARAGRRLLRSRLLRIDATCRFATRLTLPRGARGRLKAAARYGGSEELLQPVAIRTRVR